MHLINLSKVATEGWWRWRGKSGRPKHKNVATARKSQCDHRHKSNTYIEVAHILVKDMIHFAQRVVSETEAQFKSPC